MEQQEESKKDGGTAKAFGPKILEFHQYCDCCYPNHYSKYHLEYDKVYRFMFYQVYREKRKDGTNENRKNNIYFDKADYDKVMAVFYATPTAAGGDMAQLPPNPKNTVGVCTYSQWKAVFRVMYKYEVANWHTSLTMHVETLCCCCRRTSSSSRRYRCCRRRLRCSKSQKDIDLATGSNQV